MIADLLKLFRMHAEVYHNAKVCGDWLIQEGELGQTCFHMPTEGACILSLPGFPDEVLEAGELVIFPRELPHSMRPASKIEGLQVHMSYASAVEVEGTGMLCGKILFQHVGGDALISALPKVMIFKHSESTIWLHQLRQLLIGESYLNAQGLVIDRLSELVFVYAMRHYVEQDCSDVGVLALYGHSKLRLALREIHRSPQEAWTLGGLAAVSGLSRTGLAESFKAVSGWTTMQYLTWWRMQLAYDYLSQGDSVSMVAEAVGYRSEAAFSRAFRREFSLYAGEVRRAHK